MNEKMVVVQFLSGAQFETTLPVEQIPMELFNRKSEFDLELVFPFQIQLLTRDDEPTVLNALITLLHDMEVYQVIDSIAEQEENHSRYQMLTVYYQYMAFRREFVFHKDDSCYRIYSKRLQADVLNLHIMDTGLQWIQFRRADLMIDYQDDVPTISLPGWVEWNHWVQVQGELHAIRTIVEDSDCKGK